MNKIFCASIFFAACLIVTQAGAANSDVIRTFETEGKISFLVSDNGGAPITVPADVALPAVSGAQHDCRRSYPSLAERWLQQGTVLVSLRIDTNGHARDIALAKPSVHFRLNEAAQECIKKWSYLPATRDGRAVEVQHLVEVHFVLVNPGESIPKHPA